MGVVWSNDACWNKNDNLVPDGFPDLTLSLRNVKVFGQEIRHMIPVTPSTDYRDSCELFNKPMVFNLSC